MELHPLMCQKRRIAWKALAVRVAMLQREALRRVSFLEACPTEEGVQVVHLRVMAECEDKGWRRWGGGEGVEGSQVQAGLGVMGA